MPWRRCPIADLEQATARFSSARRLLRSCALHGALSPACAATPRQSLTVQCLELVKGLAAPCLTGLHARRVPGVHTVQAQGSQPYSCQPHLCDHVQANKIKKPLLLIHGADDDNSGTFPLQSERFYAALKGHGAPCKLVSLRQQHHQY